MEDLQTRTELSRSIEDAEQFQALQTLTELGMLTPVSDLDSYHGRVAMPDEKTEWAVDPSFSNASNDSGNRNVLTRSSLYTGDVRVAQDFAEQRRKDLTNQIYNRHFTDTVQKYTPEQRQEWLQRLDAKAKRIVEGNLPPSGKKHWMGPDGRPKVHTEADLQDPDMIRSEAQALKSQVPADQRDHMLSNIAKSHRVEIHKIISEDTDARVINLDFSRVQLREPYEDKYRAALRSLLIPVTEGSPVDFMERDDVAPFVEEAKKLNQQFISQNDIPKLVSRTGVSEKLATQLVSAYNARSLMAQDPAYLVDQLVRHDTDVYIDQITVGNKTVEMPVSLEYVQRYLRVNHIVGATMTGIQSATIKRDISMVSFLDLDRTATTQQYEAERRETWQKLGGIATGLRGHAIEERAKRQHPVLRLMEDAHAKPERLVEAAKHVPGVKNVYEASTGNWEGFTLGEHTETVLRNFDENFADSLPVEMLAPMRLAILAHDMGKPLAAASNAPQFQKKYNVQQADYFFDAVGIDPKLKDLLVSIIGDGEELAYQINVKKDNPVDEFAMRALAKQQLSNFYGTEEISDDQIEAYAEMCKMLMICDGGAYTNMAVTSTHDGGKYRNYPSFNSSFEGPVGLGNRDIRLKSS